MRRSGWALAILSLVIVAMFAVSHARSAPKTRPADATIRIAATTSLKEALDQIAASFEASTGIRVVIDYGASGMLERRLEDGATQADVFVSASPIHVRSLAARRLANATEMVTVAGTRLAVFVPGANPKQILAPKDLWRADEIVIGDPEIAPDGASAREWLRYIGMWTELESRIIFAQDSAQAEEYVASGQADVGIGFVNELRNDPAVAAVYMVPDEQITDIQYVAVPLRDAADDALARQFVAYLTEPGCQGIIAQCGLLPRVP